MTLFSPKILPNVTLINGLKGPVRQKSVGFYVIPTDPVQDEHDPDPTPGKEDEVACVCLFCSYLHGDTLVTSVSFTSLLHLVWLLLRHRPNS